MPLNVDVGNRVEITLASDPEGKSYVSVVEDVYENNLILMHMPISYGNLVKLPMKYDYKMMFYTEKGMYKYTARIIKYVSQGNFNFMIVELSSDAEKFQRREFFRYECIIEFKFDKLLEGETSINFDPDTILATGIIKDISAGGIRFLGDELIEADSIIKCRIPLKNDRLICAAKIVAVQNFPKSSYKYQYRAEFMELKEADKDLIVRFIFEEQRKKLKNN